jgi:nucleoside-diphosphate-sugar epimerase
MMEIAKKKRVSPYIADGQNRWAAVHRLDAAKLFRLAIERGDAGKRYHAVAEERISLKGIADRLGLCLNLPTASQTREEAAKHFGWLAPFIAADNPVSSVSTKEALDWRPSGPNLLEDICRAKAPLHDSNQ